MTDVEQIAVAAKEARNYVAGLTDGQKNAMLDCMANALTARAGYILEQNALDIAAAKGAAEHFIDRLRLDNRRISAMSEGLLALKDLRSPIGEITEERILANGLQLKKIRVPLGVVCIIYEARPNVTADAAGLCLKSSNSVVLRGSGDALNSNAAIVNVLKDALRKEGYESGFIQFVQDASRETSDALIKLNKYIDVLIPRGSDKMIEAVIANTNIPVIKTGSGNCHAYIHASANLDMAADIILNGKTQRPSVCNALESILVDRSVAETALPKILKRLASSGVEIFGCRETCRIFPQAKPAAEQDFYTEYLSSKISVKVVDDYIDAVEHINKYGTHHSETIISSDSKAIDYFYQFVDSAAVYSNASTRFTDGFEFGLGAEMGISTQKLHARGPMGLEELTAEKYLITGNGQVRK